jgi:enamine deaminase RidA (YjgF/YER057c/UK114 family)
MPNRLAAGVAGFLMGVATVSIATAHSSQARRYINPRSASNPANATQPPFSGAVMIDDTVFLSGVLGTGETAEAAARSGLNSIQNSLKAAGLTMDDLVSVQVFCPNVADYDAFNQVYRTYFKAEFPARAFIGSGPLLQNAKFEIQGIAVRR